jgi:hypothetical protein
MDLMGERKRDAFIGLARIFLSQHGFHEAQLRPSGMDVGVYVELRVALGKRLYENQENAFLI